MPISDLKIFHRRIAINQKQNQKKTDENQEKKLQTGQIITII